jgi:PmbA protein
MIEEYKKLKTKNLTINVQANEINEIREKTLEKNSTRIFNEGKIYSSNFLGSVDRETLKNNALENSYGALDYDYELNSDVSKDETYGRALSDSQVVELTKDLVDHFQKELPDFIYSGKIDYEHNDSDLEVTTGINLKKKNSHVGGFLIMKRKGSPNIMDSALGFSSGTGSVDLSSFNNFIKLHKSFDNIVEMDEGRYPVIFVSEKDFLAKFRQSCSPDSYHQGSAYYSEKLGQKIFNEKINLSDVRFDPDYGLATTFDHEGTPAEKELPLIKDGVFTNIIYDKKTAKKYGGKETGNGKRDFNMAMSPLAYTFDFAPGDKDFNTLMSEHDKAIVIIMAGGGDTTSSGDYSSPVQVGFLMEKGEVKGRTPEITITGNIDKMMGDDFIAISSDKFYPNRSHSFMCYMNVMK